MYFHGHESKMKAHLDTYTEESAGYRAPQGSVSVDRHLNIYRMRQPGWGVSDQNDNWSCCIVSCTIVRTLI